MFNQTIPTIKIFTAILWPAFIAAGIATIVLTTVVDAVDVQLCFGFADLSRLAYYSISFFVFWLLFSFTTAASGYYLLSKTNPQSQTSPESQ